jgi:hypothetical protein
MKCTVSQRLVGVALISLAVGAGGGYFAGVSTARKSEWRPERFAAGFDRDQTGNRTGIGARPGGIGRGAGMTRGELIQVGEGSLTVKLPDGGSRIVLIDDSVQVTSCSQGDASILRVGQQVMATGSVGSDGSVAAESVQIVPEWVANAPFGGRGLPSDAQPPATAAP